MYADGPGVLFELVQNAEDARASEVTFLLDKTQYGTSSVLSPEMADWQGPALYCFNDSVFSPQDLYAISRIGQESKLEKPLAIGRFGLGFNCVYHFTDIPMFVSGENIVMFDPHACNLPGIDLRSTARLLSLALASFRTRIVLVIFTLLPSSLNLCSITFFSPL